MRSWCSEYFCAFFGVQAHGVVRLHLDGHGAVLQRHGLRGDLQAVEAGGRGDEGAAVHAAGGGRGVHLAPGGAAGQVELQRQRLLQVGQRAPVWHLA